MSLTKERIEALEEILPEVDSSEESIAVIEDLIAFWREKQPKHQCVHCYMSESGHAPKCKITGKRRCFNPEPKGPMLLQTTYEEAQ